MMKASAGSAIAQAAETLVGTPFRLHGRDPVTGLDCVGLVETALAMARRRTKLPNGYALRTRTWSGFAAMAQACGFILVEAPVQPGDVCVCHPSGLQMHLLIVASTATSMVEAHAGLRRVVITPTPYPHPISEIWRLSDH